MTLNPATEAELSELESRIDGWLASWAEAQPDTADPAQPAGDEQGDRPLLLDVQRDAEIPRRWYIRLAGDTREVIAIWLTLRQRTLSYETYVLPEPPPDRVADAHGFILRRNYPTVGAHYAIGPEDALFLRGELPALATTEGELDRIVGSLWTYVERDFATLLRLCFDAETSIAPQRSSTAPQRSSIAPQRSGIAPQR